MRVQCVKVEYDCSLRLYFLTPGKKPGYKTGHQLTDLVLTVIYKNKEIKVSIGKKFKKCLFDLHGKNKQLKRLESKIQATMPNHINVTINYANNIIIDDNDIKAWAQKV